MQVIYQIISAYFEDDCADELTNEPVMTAILDKDAFIVTTMEMDPYQVIQFYCGRGKMENFIKEGKSGFDFASLSSSSRLVNANRFLVHALAYNLFNWFRRFALATNISSCVAAVRTRKNSMRHWKTSVICNRSWNDNF